VPSSPSLPAAAAAAAAAASTPLPPPPPPPLLPLRDGDGAGNVGDTTACGAVAITRVCTGRPYTCVTAGATCCTDTPSTAPYCAAAAAIAPRRE